MKLQRKWKRSAGVPVTSAVHEAIRAGNVARGQGDWAKAADAYADALAGDPALRHIWIQRGHMLKEGGRAPEAIEAYERAFELSVDDPEPFVHIAHIHLRGGDERAAAVFFLKALRAGSGDQGALDDLKLIIEKVWPVDRSTLFQAARHVAPSVVAPSHVSAGEVAASLDRVLKALAANDATEEVDRLRSATGLLQRIADAPAPANRTAMVFDVSDLIAHLRHHRLPTGIQRVQIEVVTRALADESLDVRICCFITARDQLLDIPADIFLEVADMATSGNDSRAPDWARLMARLFIHLILTEPFVFRHGDCLVNLGTSWWIYNYFLFVRNAKRDFAISYVPFVHDFIPIMASDHCVAGVVEDYITWLIGAFDLADLFLVNSRSTGDDLLRVAKRLGREVDADLIEVVPLDADFRKPPERDLPEQALARWDLLGEGYGLLVSTIESRKNHVLALEAWAKLIERHEGKAIPKLVCVGRSGWLNAAFFDRLARDPDLAEYVVIIERVSDEELALLYRHCLFTVYPSHYEGWGLPITESLCYGKVAVIADNSSLPEAGAGFALMFESNSVDAFVAELEKVLFADGCREALEKDIRENFRPRDWSAIARQVTGAIARRQLKAGPFVAHAEPGRYYPVTLHKSTRVWNGLGSGEVFRIGTGWHWPEPTGSRTRPGGGELSIRAGSREAVLRLFVLMKGLDTRDSAFSITAGGQRLAAGNLIARELRWVLCNVAVPAGDGAVSLRILGGDDEKVVVSIGGLPKQITASVAIAGFALLGQADQAGRAAFLETATLDGLEQLNAYSE